MADSDYIVRDASQFEELRLLNPYINENQGFIAGGVFKDLFLNKNFRDIDVFFMEQQNFHNEIIKLNESEEFLKKYENVNAIGFEEKSTKIRVDCVRKCFGNPTEILNSFDFSVSKFALFKDVNKKLKVIYHPYFFEDLITKKLRIDSEYKDPIAQFSRILKYSRYGFKIDKTDQIKLLHLINKLNNNQINTLLMNDYEYYY